jgi:hypothetical protein
MNHRRHLAQHDPAAGSFQTTHWSLVLRAGHREDRDADAALATLCERYRELLREEVAQTLAEPADVDDEIRSFSAVLGG